MDLYIDETGVYYCPNGDGNATLTLDGAGDLWAFTGPFVDKVATADLTIERSVDAGQSWQSAVTNIDPGQTFETVDWQGLSQGDTLYRATSYAATGASAQTVANIPADSNAAWLAAGPAFDAPAKSAFNPKRSQASGRERGTHAVLGRARPVAFAGEALSDTLSVGGRLFDPSLVADPTATREQLIDVVQDAFPVHLYRDQEGTHAYCVVGAIKFERPAFKVEDWTLDVTVVDAPDG